MVVEEADVAVVDAVVAEQPLAMSAASAAELVVAWVAMAAADLVVLLAAATAAAAEEEAATGARRAAAWAAEDTAEAAADLTATPLVLATLPGGRRTLPHSTSIPAGTYLDRGTRGISVCFASSLHPTFFF